MNKKYISIITISIIVIVSIVVLMTNKKADSTNTLGNNVAENKIVAAESEKEVPKKESSAYRSVNKDGLLASKLFEFLPKYYQTYTDKMSEDHMLYDAISRLSKDESYQKITVGEFYGYKYADVDKMYKYIYGENLSAPKKESYSIPVEYIKSSDAFCVYPHSPNDTDDMMVIKSIEENDEYYKVTVYSVCVYVDVNSSSYNDLYIVTKDTMKKFYANGIRGDISIVSTYKKFELTSEKFNPEDVVTKYESYLPQIEFYLKKADESGLKYYVSDIKDVY